jgi:mRNA deadenylase 3'-5' endonuclease subunit Ccr4
MTFTVATYNVLADAYLKPDWYPNTPEELLKPERRLPRVVEHVLQLQADIYCLQEVEEGTFAALERCLSSIGYTGKFAKKSCGKPDGCAILWKTHSFKPLRVIRIEYCDGDRERPNSGHIGQLMVMRGGDCLLGIANTHLKWDPPEKPREQKYGYRQIQQLLNACATCTPACTGWIIAGDFDATPDTEVVAALREAGFEFSHVACRDAHTCNSNHRPKMIDYLFHNRALRASPTRLPIVEAETALPGPGQPSDHVAVIARFVWTE